MPLVFLSWGPLEQVGPPARRYSGSSDSNESHVGFAKSASRAVAGQITHVALLLSLQGLTKRDPTRAHHRGARISYSTWQLGTKPQTYSQTSAEIFTCFSGVRPFSGLRLIPTRACQSTSHCGKCLIPCSLRSGCTR
jgi:hypothetical protein